MCGIAGWYEQQPPADNAPLQSMLAAMAARGPDDRGTAEIRARAGGCWNLGACRLAILDLSPAGHQPMRDAETGNWLAYNGEIYNFRELRAELESRGCVFRSRCDTEVLLLGYRIWGEEVLSRLRGMFAFAVWDEHDQSLLLARDRHGIKPLYYAQAAGRFLFASELRALLASGLIARELDRPRWCAACAFWPPDTCCAGRLRAQRFAAIGACRRPSRRGTVRRASANAAWKNCAARFPMPCACGWSAMSRSACS
jgi:asparagine synthase (glutamine-hydrolysing)